MILFAVVALILFVKPLFSCTCSFPDPKTALREADLAFRGTIVNIEYLDPPRTVQDRFARGGVSSVPRRFLATLNVTGVWKGNVGRSIVLHTREGSSDCVGFWTDLGKDVLVFARRGVVTPKEPDTIRISEWIDKVPAGEIIISPGICTLTDEVVNAKDTLRKIGRPKPPGR